MSSFDVFDISFVIVAGVAVLAVTPLIVRWLRRRSRSDRRDRGSDYEESGDSTLASREGGYGSADSGGGDGD